MQVLLQAAAHIYLETVFSLLQTAIGPSHQNVFE